MNITKKNRTPSTPVSPEDHESHIGSTSEDFDDKET